MTEKVTTKGNRIHFLDNLRTIIILLVVLYHAGGVYEGTGMWAVFWIVDDPATNNLSGILNLIVDIFVMPTIFLISGYLTPMSLRSKSGWSFLKSKFRRLVIPWIIAVFTLVPLYKVIFLYSRDLPQENWTSYFHFSSGSITGQGHLWFLPLLFLFNILYLLFSKVKIRIPNISLKGAVIGTFLIGWVYSASMDVFGLRGWTLTPLLDFQRERVLIYFMYFLLGALCFRLKVFDAKPESKKLYNIVNYTSWIPITVYIFFLILPVLSPGTVIVSKIIDRVIVWFCFHLSLLCLVYVMIVTFWRYLDKPGRIWNELNRNSYYVYIIHVIVLGGIASLLLKPALPSLVKYPILVVSSYAACNLIISLYRRAVTSQ
jgi:fucose 4-O-acetylase-like acetyltransferase